MSFGTYYLSVSVSVPLTHTHTHTHTLLFHNHTQLIICHKSDIIHVGYLA